MLAGMATTVSRSDVTAVSDEELAALRDVAGLYDRYAHRMLSYVSSRGVPAHDLDDLLQELWTRVYNALNSRTFEGHFSGWIFQIARNLICDRVRKPNRLEGLPADDLMAMADRPESVLTRQEVHDQLARCLNHLEERERKIVQARTAGDKYDEVCATLGIEKNTAYKIFHKAMARLAECMKRAGYESGGGDDS
jgi:RNA polymerase sigma-70 factor, ECF subfamily